MALVDKLNLIKFCVTGKPRGGGAGAPHRGCYDVVGGREEKRVDYNGLSHKRGGVSRDKEREKGHIK